MKLAVALLSMSLAGSVLGRPPSRACRKQARSEDSLHRKVSPWNMGGAEEHDADSRHRKTSLWDVLGSGGGAGDWDDGKSDSRNRKTSPSDQDESSSGGSSDAGKSDSSNDKAPPSDQEGSGAGSSSQGEANSNVHHKYSDSWSGAVLMQPSSGYFQSVTGRFTVPKPKHLGSAGEESVAVWVGIDGETCHSGLLQAGVDLVVTKSGEVSYQAWYEWFPALSDGWEDFKISAGDVIQIDVVAMSTTKGTTKLTNVSTGQTVTKDLEAPGDSKLCRGNAEWIVEKHTDAHDKVVPWNNFGTVVFEAASAKLSTGSQEDLSGASVLDLQDKQTGTIYTNTTINSGSKVTIKYTEERGNR